MADDRELEASGDRRVQPRLTSVRAATITLFEPPATIACVLVEVSATGARLHVHHQSEVPDRFRLEVEAESLNRECRVVWRRNDEIGLMFD